MNQNPIQVHIGPIITNNQDGNILMTGEGVEGQDLFCGIFLFFLYMLYTLSITTSTVGLQLQLWPTF